MKKISKVLVVLSTFSVFSFVGCDANKPQDINYAITLTKFGETAVADADVSFIKDGNVVSTAKTDTQGKVEVSLSEGDYVVEFSSLPSNYRVEENVTLTKDNPSADIECVTRLKEDFASSSTSYDIGEVVNDFVLQGSDGKTIALSSILQEKKMVVLNFWGIWCPYCVAEMPFMEQAYQELKDDIGIVALNPTPNERTRIQNFKNEYSLSFDLAYDNLGIYNNYMKKNSWPATAIIDRYGILCEVEYGAKVTKEDFLNWFNPYLAEDYVPARYY